MIYTVGRRDIYEKGRAENGDDWKKLGRLADGLKNGGPYDAYYPGGSVWQTLPEAQSVADKNPGFGVYGVDAVWDIDTEPSKDGSHHDLLRTARLISLESVE